MLPQPRDELAASSAADGLKPKDLVGIPWRVAFALQERGWWLALRRDLGEAEPDAGERARSTDSRA